MHPRAGAGMKDERQRADGSDGSTWSEEVLGAEPSPDPLAEVRELRRRISSGAVAGETALSLALLEVALALHEVAWRLEGVSGTAAIDDR